MKRRLFDEFEFYGAKASEAQLEMWVDELKDFSVQEVNLALIDLRKDSKRNRPPFPAVIRERISGFLGAEQAWSEAPKSEDDSAVMTNEAAMALSSASPFLREGNMIQARLVFLEVYEKEVAKALAQNKKAKWFASFGAYSSPESKDKAVLDAVAKNRITKNVALEYRSNLEIESKTNLRQLTTSQSSEEITDEVRERNLQRARNLLKELNQKTKAKISIGPEN